MSRRHCKIVPVDDGYLLRDLDSQNGTWVDGQRIDQAYIETGTRFNVGNVLLELKEDGTLIEPVVYTGAKRHLTIEEEEAKASAIAEAIAEKLASSPVEVPAAATLDELPPAVEIDEEFTPAVDVSEPRSSFSSTAAEVPTVALNRDVVAHVPSDVTEVASAAPTSSKPKQWRRSSTADRWRFAAALLLIGGLTGYWIGGDRRPPRESQFELLRPSGLQRAAAVFDRPAGDDSIERTPVTLPAVVDETMVYRIGPWDPVSLPLRPTPVAVGRAAALIEETPIGASTPEAPDSGEGTPTVERVPTPSKPERSTGERISMGPAQLFGPLVSELELDDYCDGLLANALPLLERYHVEAYSYQELLPILRDFQWLDRPRVVDALFELREENLKIERRLTRRIKKLTSDNTVSLGGGRRSKPVEKELAYHLFTLLTKQHATVHKSTIAIEATLFSLRLDATVLYALKTVIGARDRDAKVLWVEHVGQLAISAAIPVLIDQVGTSNYTLRRAVRKSLESLTGRDLGSRKKDWVAWWESKNQKEDT